MKLSKKFLISSLLAFTAACVFAQQSTVQKKSTTNTEEETSVESEYLNDVDGDIIMTLADSDEYDNKLVALQYLEQAINDGNTSDAVIQAMDKLAGEGLTNQTRIYNKLTQEVYDELVVKIQKKLKKIIVSIHFQILYGQEQLKMI